MHRSPAAAAAARPRSRAGPDPSRGGGQPARKTHRDGDDPAPERAPTLACTRRSTNAIENMISICRKHAKNVTRWQHGTMALRWCAADMAEAGTQFRRAGGHLHLPALRTALPRHTAELETVGPNWHTEPVNAA